MSERNLQLFRPFQASKGKGSLYKQLAAFIEALLRSHLLQPGDRLPAERELATLLGLSRTTVTAAYGEIIALGLAATAVGRGTFVEIPEQSPSDVLPSLPPWAQPPPILLDQLLTFSTRSLHSAHDQSHLISFAAGMPAPEALPEDLREVIQQLVQTDLSAVLGTTPAAGLPELRKQIAMWMTPFETIRAKTQEEVIVTAGAQQALDFVARLLVRPGDTVLLQQPTSIGALQVFQSYGARLLPFDLAHPGSVSLETLPKLLYLQPTWHNPTGQSLTLEERREVLTFSAHFGIPVVEDDPYGPLWFYQVPPPSLWSLAPSIPGSQVISIGTCSKILASGLRIGWIRSHNPYAHLFAQLKQTSDLHTNTLAQWVALEYFSSKRLEAHLVRLRSLYHQRCERLLALLRHRFPKLSCQPPSGGYYLWCRLPGIQSLGLLPFALQQGVAFLPGPSCYPVEGGTEWLRLSFASPALDSMEEGVHRLASAVATFAQQTAV